MEELIMYRNQPDSSKEFLESGECHLEIFIGFEWELTNVNQGHKNSKCLAVR